MIFCLIFLFGWCNIPNIHNITNTNRNKMNGVYNRLRPNGPPLAPLFTTQPPINLNNVNNVNKCPSPDWNKTYEDVWKDFRKN